jgi:hypothetical protein
MLPSEVPVRSPSFQRLQLVAAIATGVALVGGCAAAPESQDRVGSSAPAPARVVAQQPLPVDPGDLDATPRAGTPAAPRPTTTLPGAVPSPTVPVATIPPVAPAPGTRFVHPGILVDGARLSAARSAASQGLEPAASALAKLRASGYARLSWTPAPVPSVQAAGASGIAWMEANPQYGYGLAGEVSHLDDAVAAYTHALLWAYTGDTRHADKAIEIMNAWSSVLTEIKFDQPRRPDTNAQIYSNGKLHAAWAGTLNARAAEIIRHTSNRWSAGDVDRYERMLEQVYLPLTITSWTGGANWLMSLVDATMSIAVFLDDRQAFDTAVAQWRSLFPTTVYMASDGAVPRSPSRLFTTQAQVVSYWHSPIRFEDGLQGEALRDISHMMMGMGAAAHAAQTAGLQGVDLFGEQQGRMVAAFERAARSVNEYLDEKARLGGEPASTWVPSNWLGAPGTFRVGGTGYRSGWEVVYRNLAVDRGVPMPQTQRVVERVRPANVALHMSWETMTSA